MAIKGIKEIALGNNNNYLIEPTLYTTVNQTSAATTFTADLDKFELFKGVTIAVKFGVTNNASATLNINGTGAKAIYYEGAAITASKLKAKHTYIFTYNGTQWELVGDLDTNTQSDYGNITTSGKIGTGNNLVVTSSGTVQAGATISSAISTQTTSTKFLREDGTWAAPSYTTNIDEKVSQIGSTDDKNFPIILKNTDGADETSGVKYSNNTNTDVTKTKPFTFNPSTGTLTVSQIKIGTKDDNMGLLPNLSNWNQIGSGSLYWYRAYINNYYGNNSHVNNWDAGKNIGTAATSSTAATKGSVNFYNTAAVGATQTKTLLEANTNTNSDITITLPSSTGNLALISDIPTKLSDLEKDLTYSDFGAAAANHGTHVTTATVKSALGTVSTTAKKFLKDTGAWVQVDWGDLTGKPSSFTPSSHTHYELSTIADNRNDNTTPNDYKNRFIFQGLKYNNKINSPYTDTYSYLIGLRGWSDNSGGDAHEFAFNGNGVYRRQGQTTEWGDWLHLLDSGNTTAPSTVPTLSWNTESTVFTLNGSAVKIKAMAQPSYAFTDLTSHPTTLSGYGITNAVQYNGVDNEVIGGSASAAGAKNYWADNTKVPKDTIVFNYNSSGTEYTTLFSNRNNQYGTILKWSYTDTYIRILRAHPGQTTNNGWYTSDWEKISAGYADSAGKATNDVDGNAIKTTYAKLASPTFTGTPKSVTPSSTSDSKMIATKEYVDGIVAANDAMVFKGTLNGAASTTYTPAADRGHTYKVAAAGLINGEQVEVGDILICITDGTVQATSSNVSTVKTNWVIVQNNVDGAVFKSTNSFTDGYLLAADGTNGKIKTINSLSGPFRVYTSASAANAFKISRLNSDGECVAHWVDDSAYHIEYTNDERASSVQLRIINTDTEGGGGANPSDYTYTFNSTGGITGATFSGNATSADSAKWLMNRGTNVAVADSSWAHGQKGRDGTNTSGGTVWKQKWTQSGLTYTPSNGSATTLTDSGDIVYWLSQSPTSNDLWINMAIDGYIYSHSGFKVLTQSAAYNEGIRFVNSSAVDKGSINTDNNGVLGIYGASKISLRPALNQATDGIEITTTNMNPTKNQAVSLGGTSNQWANVYSQIFTMTHKQNASDGFKVLYGSTIDFFLGVGTGNENHGLYDNKAGKWILLAGTNNDWSFDGNANTSTTAKYIKQYYTVNSTAAPLQIRSNNANVYIWQVGHATSESGSFSNNYVLQYYGEGASPNNYLILKTSNSSTVTDAIKIDELGNVIFANKITGDIDTVDGLHATDMLRVYYKNTDLSSTDAMSTTNYLFSVGDTGGWPTTATKPTGTDNAFGILHMHLHSGNYFYQLGMDATKNKLHFRSAYNSTTWGAWNTVLASNNYTDYALSLSGGTMTGDIKGNQTVALGTAANPFHNIVLGGTTSATMTAASTNPRITFQENTGTQPVHLIYTDYDNYRSPAGLKLIGGTSATPAWFEVEGNIYAAAFKGKADFAYHTSNAHYSTTSGSPSGVLKVKIKKKTSWMLAFTIRVYQEYDYTDIGISGYNYGSRLWYSPKARIISSTSTNKLTVSFGYDDDAVDDYRTLWVSIPVKQYTGIDIFNVTNGYTQIDLSDAFEIIQETTSTGTVQATTNVYRPLYRDDSLETTNLAGDVFKWQTTSLASTALYDFGAYVAQNTAGGTGPNGSNYYNLINIPYRKASGNTKLDWGWQLGNTTSNDNRLYYRTTGDNTAGDWQTIAHATTSSDNTGSARQPVYMTYAGTITTANYTVAHFGNAGKSNMNDIGRLHASTGMTNLADPGNNNDNPMNGSTKSTSWHLYWDTNYTDDPNGSNSWAAQIANKAGTSQWWVRSRSGGTITNGTEWASNWRHLVTSDQAGVGGTGQPVYVDTNGELQVCTSYADASVNYATSAENATTASKANAANITTTANTLAFYSDSTGSFADTGIKYYQNTSSAGKTYIGWVKFASIDIGTNNYWGDKIYDIFLDRTYNSPASEVYNIRVSAGWVNSNIIQLSGHAGNQIMTKFRIVRNHTTHMAYFEYYVNTSYTTYQNTVNIKILGYHGAAVTLMNEVQTEDDSVFTYKEEIDLTNGMVSNGNFSGSFSGNASTSTSATYLTTSTRMDYGWTGINYYQISAANQSAAKVNDTPFSTATWTHILRFNHGNSAGYYTDLAIPFNANGIYYKRIAADALQNSTTNGGWVKVLDQLNYSSYALPISGGKLTGNLELVSANSGISNTANKRIHWYTLNNDGTLNAEQAYISTANNGNLAINALNDIYLRPGSGTVMDTAEYSIIIDQGLIYPYTTDKYNLGASTNKWIGVYANTFYGALDGNAATATKIAITTAAPTSSKIVGYIPFSTAVTGNNDLYAQDSLYLYDTVTSSAISSVYLNVGKSQIMGGITLHSATNANAHGNLVPATISANTTRTWTLPNATGTIALTSSNVTSADSAKWLMNRGTNVTIGDSAWAHGITGRGGTNTSGGTVWKQKWTQSGLTYTPSGGSATTLSDSGDLVIWLSQDTTSNNLWANMAIDGYVYSLSGFRGGGLLVGKSEINQNVAAGANSDLLRITNTRPAANIAANNWFWGTDFVVTNMIANTNACHVFGKANSTKNSGVLNYHHAGDASNDNYVGLGLYGVEDILTTYANRTVQVNGKLCLNRVGSASYGRISYYKSNYVTWFTYMSDTANGAAPTGGKPSTLGNITSWGLRTLIENASGYGWLWEAAANSAASANTVEPTVRMGLSSNTGQLRIAPNASSSSLESGGLIIDGAKNASSGNVAIELWRGGNASWQIANEGGNLYIRNNWTTAKQTTYNRTSITVNYNTGNTTFAGSVTASGGFSGDLSGNATSASKISAALVNNKKTYLLGTETAITATATNVSLTGDTGVYLTTTAGELSAYRYSWHYGSAERAYSLWNDTDQSIDFIFL